MKLKCCACKKNLDEKNFSKRRNCKRGYAYKCKDCHNKYSREAWYPKNNKKQILSSNNWRIKNRIRYLCKRYKINEEEVKNAFLYSNGKCQICGGKTDLVIDHCHKTNKFRGLLCLKCNFGLGYFKDNITFLNNAIKYLSGQ